MESITKVLWGGGLTDQMGGEECFNYMSLSMKISINTVFVRI
jgi:hypothetical protein